MSKSLVSAKKKKSRMIAEPLEARLLFSGTAELALLDDTYSDMENMSSIAKNTDLVSVYQLDEIEKALGFESGGSSPSEKGFAQAAELDALGIEFTDLTSVDLPWNETHETEEPNPFFGEVIFVDQSIQDYQSLLNDLIKNTDGNVEVVLLDSERDGIAQITSSLSGYEGVTAIHLLSHGSSGEINVGNSTLGQSNLASYKDDLLSWRESLTESADILFYGCNVAESEEGLQLIDEIAKITEADVAASTNLTGSEVWGGDWDLEAEFGSVEANSFFSGVTDFTWKGVLASPTIDVLNIDINEGGTVVFNSDAGNQISASDVEDSGNDLVFGVNFLDDSIGSFRLVSDNSEIWSFTQQQVDNGEIKFVHNGGEFAPSFSLIVNDSNNNYSGFVAASVTFTNVNDVGSIRFSGELRETQTLTASDISDSDGSVSNETYQWQSSVDGSGIWTNISGATNSTYTLVVGDVDRLIRLTANYDDPVTSNESISSSASVVTVNDKDDFIPDATDDSVTVWLGETVSGNVIDGVGGVNVSSDVAGTGDIDVHSITSLSYTNDAGATTIYSGFDAAGLTGFDASGNVTIIADSGTFTINQDGRYSYQVTSGSVSNTVDTGEMTSGSSDWLDDVLRMYGYQAGVSFQTVDGDLDLLPNFDFSALFAGGGGLGVQNGAGAGYNLDNATGVGSEAIVIDLNGAYENTSNKYASAEVTFDYFSDANTAIWTAYDEFGVVVGTGEVSGDTGDDGSLGSRATRVITASEDFRYLSFEVKDAGDDFTVLDVKARQMENLVYSLADSNGDWDTATLAVGFADVNNAPVLAADRTVNVAEETNLVGTFSADDAEDDGITYSLSGVDAGLFNINTSGVLLFNVAPDYESDPLSYSVTVTATDDNAQGALSDSQSLTVTVTNTNLAPVNTLPSTPSVNEDTNTLIAGISVSDSEGLASTQLTVANGVINVSVSGAAVISSGGSGTPTITISGNQADINNTLSSLSYQANDDFNGIDTLTVLSIDNDGSPLSDTDILNITVNPIDDSPINSMPSAQVVLEDTDLSITTLSVNDVDNNLASTQLSVVDGTLTVTLDGSATLSAGVNGSNTLTISGTQVEINNTLNSLIYRGNQDFSGLDTLTVLSTDETGTPLTDSDTVNITVNNVADAPVNIVPIAQVVNEDTSLSISGMSVNDPDDNLTSSQVSVLNGSLTVNLTGGATISSGANDTASITLDGSQVEINAALATLTYQGASNFIGSDTLTILSSDDTGVALTDSDTVLITIDSVNDLPVNTVPSAQVVDEGLSLPISGISVSDIEGMVSTQLSVNDGVLTVSLGGAATISSGAVGSNTLTISGNHTDINATLLSLIYQGNSNFNGSDALTVLSTDNLGATATDTVAITVIPINDAPVNNLPVSLWVDTNASLAITGISVNDNEGMGSTQLSVNNGILSVSLGGSAVISAGADETSTITITGSQTDINATLASLIYQGNANFSGSDSLTVFSMDNNGIPLSDTDSVGITVNALPVNTVPMAQTVNEDSALAIAGISVSDAEGMSSTRLSVNNGVLTVSLGGAATISSGAVGSNTLTISGNQTDINNTLSSLIYQGNSNFNGSDILTVLSEDSFSASDIDTVLITVSSINDAPEALEENLVNTNEDTAVSIDVLSNDTDLDGTIDPSSVEIVVIPDNGIVTVDALTGEVTYTPSANYYGFDSFIYTVNDNEGATSDPVVVNIDVLDINDNPIALNDTVITTQEDVPIVFAVIDNDTDIDGSIDPSSVGIVLSPTNGSISMNAVTGELTYTANTNYNGEDSFSYSVRDDDGAESNIITINISVLSINDAPILVSSIQDQYAFEDQGFSFTFDTNTFNDIEGESLIYVAEVDGASLPAWLQFDASSRTFSGTPVLSDVGSFVIDIIAQDASGGVVTESFLLQALEIDDAPMSSGLADLFVLEDSEPSQINLHNIFSDEEDGPQGLEYQVIANTNQGLIQNVAINPQDGILRLEYSADSFGTSVVTVQATDSSNQVVNTSFEIHVDSVNDAPIVMPAQDLSLVMGSQSESIFDLAQIFSDLEDGSDLTFIVESNSNSSLADVVYIDPVSRILVIEYAQQGLGKSELVISAMDSHGSVVSVTLGISIRNISVFTPPDFNFVDSDFKLKVFNNFEEDKKLEVDTEGNEEVFETPSRVDPGKVIETLDVVVHDRTTGFTDLSSELDTTSHSKNHKAVINQVQGEDYDSEVDSVSELANLVSVDKSFLNDTDIADFNEEIRLMRENMLDIVEQEKLQSAVFAGVSLSITTSLFVWAMRAGSFFLTLFSMAPMWKSLDPLPVVSSSKRTKELGLQKMDKSIEDKQASEVGYLFEHATDSTLKPATKPK